MDRAETATVHRFWHASEKLSPPTSPLWWGLSFDSDFRAFETEPPEGGHSFLYSMWGYWVRGVSQ